MYVSVVGSISFPQYWCELNIGVRRAHPQNLRTLLRITEMGKSVVCSKGEKRVVRSHRGIGKMRRLQETI